MFKFDFDLSYRRYIISNFLAAFSGGVILGKCLEVIQLPYLKIGSILAFFVGTMLGLVFIQLLPKKNVTKIANLFSYFGALSSFILLIFFWFFSDGQVLKNFFAIIFFILLCFRFSFWFYSRVRRAELVAGQNQKIASVEFGYFLGMILGLIVWDFLNLNFPIVFFLAIDCLFQLLAGWLDRQRSSSLSIKQNSVREPVKKENTSSDIIDRLSFWKLSNAVVFLTVSIQVTIFSLTQNVSQQMSCFMIASYYFGTALASLACKKLNIELTQKSVSNFIGLRLNSKSLIFSLSFSMLILLLAFLLTIIIYLIFEMTKATHVLFLNHILLILTIISAFIYEVLALAILDKIGLLDNDQEPKVMKTYGFMGLAATLFLFIYTQIHVISFVLFTSLFLLFLSIYFLSFSKKVYQINGSAESTS